jgi:small subunit ribosomal protein S16
MAVIVRLRRMGSSKQPFYRVVVADERTATGGRFIEAVGWYDPRRDASSDVSLDMARIDYWVGCGARLSDTVRNLRKRVRMQAPAETAAPAAEVPAEAAAEAPANE